MDKFPLDNLSTRPTDSRSLSVSSENPLTTLVEAKAGASRLLGCYRTGDANDPEVYVAAVVSVLNRYPIEVIRDVTEPATGLASQSKWLPTIAEVRAECDKLNARIERQVYLDRQLQEQFALRQEDERPRDNRPTYEELRRRCHEVGLMIGPKGSRLPPVDPAKIREKYGVSKEQWDAIPNAPKRA